MIEFLGVSKYFGSLSALDNVSIVIEAGEVHAFLGENGAGKSTLMKILAGSYALDVGSLTVAGQNVDFKTPLKAMQAGIAMMHQNFSVIPGLKVWENFAYTLGAADKGLKRLFFSSKKIADQIIHFAGQLKFRVDPYAFVCDLSEGEKQKLEIIKIIMSDARILILDEPSSLLTPPETDSFLKKIREMAGAGRTVLLITHKINEVISYADKVTVLRKGKVVKSAAVTDTDEKTLAVSMIGEVGEKIEKVDFVDDSVQPILKFENLCLRRDDGKFLENLSFSMYRGEIFGLAGISGEGQVELAELVAGFLAPESGKVFRDHSITSSKISFIPENPRDEGVVEDFTLKENLLLSNELLRNVSLAGRWLSKISDAEIKKLITRYSVYPNRIEMLARYLSGGNLQRLILARELTTNPKLLVALYPTRGLDVGAAQFIRNKLVELAGCGAAVFFISEDINELVSICDRIMVVGRGRVEVLANNEDITSEKIGMLLGASESVVNF